MKSKINKENILAYLQGKLRYKLYYSKFAFLIRTHIKEQIDVRINSMDRQCYNEGQCKLCGCTTTALQMANKACDKPCYPRMLTRSEWWLLKRTKVLTVDRVTWRLENNKFIIENIELFKACEADIKVLEPFTIEDIRNGKFIKEAIVPNNNCKDE